MYPVSPIQPDLHSSQLVNVGRVGWQDTNLLSSWSSPSNFAISPVNTSSTYTGQGECSDCWKATIAEATMAFTLERWQASTLAPPDMPPLLGGDWNRTSISDARFGRGLRRIILRKGALPMPPAKNTAGFIPFSSSSKSPAGLVTPLWCPRDSRPGNRF